MRVFQGRRSTRMRRWRVGAALGVLAATAASPAAARPFDEWGAASNAESLAGTSATLNTAEMEGCPIEAPDELSLYFASTRPGGSGGIDIWVAERASASDGWGEPVVLPPPVNSPADDFCPTPVRGGGLFFVSTRDGGCGGGDIYAARRSRVRGWSTVTHLPCAADGGPNSAAGEAGPSYVEADGRRFLYFSSGPDIHVSEGTADGFGPAAAVPELNSSSADLRPNVRKDGLEVVFDSDRPGGLGGFDVYRATRATVDAPWSEPVNLGAAVNSEWAETRPSLSWDATRLYFGSNRPGGDGGADIHAAHRTPRRGAG